MPDIRRHVATLLPLAALLILAPLAGCKKSEPAPEPAAAPAPVAAPVAAPAPAAEAIKVVALKIGKAIGADKNVATEVDTFAKADTIYAAVGTTGSGSAKLTAKWAWVARSGAQKAVSEDTQAIAPTGPATTEFHVSKPDGWPAGDYKVEILLDGTSVATKAFRVAK